MNLNGRLSRIERSVVPPEDDGPASILELVTGKRDLEGRRRLGRAGVREAVRRMREVIARFAADPGEPSDEDLIADADRAGSKSEGSFE